METAEGSMSRLGWNFFWACNWNFSGFSTQSSGVQKIGNSLECSESDNMEHFFFEDVVAKWRRLKAFFEQRSAQAIKMDEAKLAKNVMIHSPMFLMKL